jgi:hypothetical protein
MTTSHQYPEYLSGDGAPETIRTSDLALRRRSLYPTELPGQKSVCGGAEEDRTPDLVIANDALSQLSYGPVKIPVWINIKDRIHQADSNTMVGG